MTLLVAQTPAELLDYEINWTARGIGTDTIASSAWAPSSADFTISNTSFNNNNTVNGAAAVTSTFWLTGGIPGNFYTITNSIVTAGGREMQETVVYECIAARTS